MLFGHQDNTNQQSAATPTDAPDPNMGVNPLAVDPATGSSLPVVPPDSPGPIDTPAEPSILDQGPVVAPDYTPTDNPIVSAAMPDPSSPFSPDPTPAPTSDPIAAPAIVTDASASSPLDSSLNSVTTDTASASAFTDGSVTTAADPALESPVATADVSAPTASVASWDSTTRTPANDANPDTDALFSLKQQVVTELSPLVAHLEQSPEEKFKTTMMLLQSTDNSALLQSAYSLAQQIPDEKARAQALLDVVNEINYFTQQQSNPQ
jgi:hypothetical protein